MPDRRSGAGGVALSALAVTGIVGGFRYGLRRWAGHALGHTLTGRWEHSTRRGRD